MTDPARLADGDKAQLAAILAACGELTALHDHIAAFAGRARAGPGIYHFRARLRQLTTNADADYSAAKSITIS
jgi:hypothetical protein